MNDNRLYLGIWIIVGTVLLGMTFTIASCDTRNTRLWTENGYCQTQLLPAVSSVIWTKCETVK